jgi:uncharacterized protein YbjT (DUF2867 family)
MTDLDVVTGAFSYSGAAIARAVEASGRRVRTLTGHPERAPAGTTIDVRPLAFDDPPALVESLRGVRTLYNTYWVRFAKGRIDHDAAVANSAILFDAAHTAGVQRIVHVSITHPSADSPYPYFRGKASVEQTLAQTGVSHAVLRPAILFGGDGVLVNNIAWLLRHVPVFAVGGDGNYRIRGIHVDDLARLCVEAGSATGNTTIDAVGPERPTFREMVHAIRRAVGSRSLVVGVPGALVPPMSAVLGLVLRDTLLTRDEYRAMADGLADTDGPATGQIAFSDWLAASSDTLGRHYANELRRHFR